MEQIKVDKLRHNRRNFEILTYHDREKGRLFLEAWEGQGEGKKRLAGVTEEVQLRGLTTVEDPAEHPDYLMALASIRYNVVIYAYN